MGGKPFRLQVIRGMLNGREFVDASFLWNDDDAARVLAGRAFNARAFRREESDEVAIDLRDVFADFLDRKSVV